MPIYIIDENLPATIPFWNNGDFVHVSALARVDSDTEIRHYALKHNLTIITKDTDFYNRHLASVECPKVIWFKTGNLMKKDFGFFVERCWSEIESLLSISSLIIVEQGKMEGL